MVVGDLEEDRLRIVNGGHFPPSIKVDEDGARFVEQRGRPVGLFEEVSYEARTLSFAPGEKLVMFSDGVLDAMENIALPEKESRLLAAAERDSMDDIWQALQLQETVTRDDMTCLTLVRED